VNNDQKEKILSRGEKVNRDVTALLKARHTLLLVVTREEARGEAALVEAAGDGKYDVCLWDCADGLSSSDGRQLRTDLTDPVSVLQYIGDTKKRMVYILRDLHKWYDPVVLRKLRNLARSLQSSPVAEARSIVLLSPVGDVPPELTGHATVVDYPLPDRSEVTSILDKIVSQLPDQVREYVFVPQKLREAGGVALPSEEIEAVRVMKRDQAIDAAVGLTAEEASNCYAKSLVSTRAIDPAVVATEKKRVIAREKVLTWYDPDPRGMAAVGGLDCLKGWLAQRREALGPRARAFGLPVPKGVLLVGVPGCGKSLMAKCVSAAWSIPLLRLDLGAIKSKWVGESEGNLRRALSTAEAVSPCVLWLDEVEKALGGALGPQGDGGVSSDALGAILSWMQERQGSVFVIATANNVALLPPELLRKGRFDEMFWVDLPQEPERREVFAAAIAQHGRDPASVDLDALASATEGFTGSEIASVVPDALFAAFADGERAITTADLLTACGTVVPLAKSAGERLNALRDWAKGRTRNASTPVAEVKRASGGRAVDLDPGSN
jgi:hypothetical protein